MSHPLESLSFQALFDAIADAALLADDMGRVIFANPAARQLLGYAEDEIAGLTIEQLIPARYRTSHIHHRNIFFSQRQKRPMGDGRELVALNRDGRELSVDISLSPLVAQGHYYVLITIVDAAPRHETENALQTSEERLHLAKQAAGLGIFDRDLTSGALHLDERSCELLGLEPEEAVTYEKFLAVMHPEDHTVKQVAIDRALDPASNGEYQADFRIIRHSDGVTRWVATTGRVFFESGRAVRIVGVIQDITERKSTEQRFLKLRAERETLHGQQVAILAASAIAHDLNQPLAAISAYSEVALHALSNNPMSSETLSRALEGCVQQAQRAGQSLHELLDFLRGGEIASEPIDLNSIVYEALGIVLNEGFGGFQPVLKLEHGLPSVLGNRIHVQKVLVNLLRNGVEAMREAGVPTSAITIKVQTMAEKNMAQVTVQDSGPGLDVNAVKRVFEPFYTSKSRGIGLGLVISRSLIEANGGELWVDAGAGPGATFHFTLPFAP